jgi:transcriptional regulator NrdR family protein
MECPACGSYDSHVLKSYVHISRNIRIRIRVCLKCAAIIRTEEKINITYFKRNNPNKKIMVDA